MNAPLKLLHRPCISCPYRKDVPSGLWSIAEYEKLRLYDLDTAYQPRGLFQCHSKPGEAICSGWVACHGDELLALRIGVSKGDVNENAFDYESPVAVFGSGNEACDHGLADIDNPGAAACRMMAKIRRRQLRRADAKKLALKCAEPIVPGEK